MDPHPQIRVKKKAVFKKIVNFSGKLLQHYKQLECEIFRLLLKHVSDHLSVLFQFVWLHIFFFYLGFLSRTFTNHRTAGEGEGISLTPHYHFHPLHRHLDISWAITAESSPLHIASSRARTRNLWLPSGSR